jgi:hypothetical protein
VSQIHLQSTLFPKVQSFMHLQKQILWLQIKIRFVVFLIAHCFTLLFILLVHFRLILLLLLQPTGEDSGRLPNRLSGFGIPGGFLIWIPLCVIYQSASDYFLSTLAPSSGLKWPVLPEFLPYGFVCNLQIGRNLMSFHKIIVSVCLGCHNKIL